MKSRIISLLLPLAIILFGATVLVAYAAGSSFGVHHAVVRFDIGIVMGILTVGFIAMMIIARRANNAVTRFFYKLFSTWMGLFVYLFFAAIVFTITQTRIIGEISFILAILATMYGLIQAATIRIMNYDVALSNLPDSWKGRTIAFVSDIHLGQVYGAGFSRRIIDKINSMKPDLVLIGGDLFDGGAIDEGSAVEPFRDIRSVHGTYFVTGNHDEYGNESAYLRAIKNVGINILNNEIVSIDGLQIVGFDYGDAACPENYARLMKKINLDASKPSVCIKHVPNDLDIPERAGVSLHLSGHTHRGQMFPFMFITKRIYRGFDYGLKKLGAMQSITSSGVGGWGPAVRVGTKSEVVSIKLGAEKAK